MFIQCVRIIWIAYVELCVALKKGPKNITDILLWINSIKKNIGPIIHIAVMAHHAAIFWSSEPLHTFLSDLYCSSTYFCSVDTPSGGTKLHQWTKWVCSQEHHIIGLPAKISYKNMFFCCNCLLQLLELLLFYTALVSTAFCLVYLLFKAVAMLEPVLLRAKWRLLN
jgi:hypothetical protein